MFAARLAGLERWRVGLEPVDRPNRVVKGLNFIFCPRAGLIPPANLARVLRCFFWIIDSFRLKNKEEEGLHIGRLV